MPKLSTLLNPSSSVTGANNPMSSASQPKASYFIPTFNTSSGSYQAMFLDSEFNKISYVTARPYYGSSASFDSLNSTYESENSVFTGVSGSQTQQTTSSAFYLSGLWNGPYGCSLVRGSSRSVISSNATMWPTTDVGTYSSEASTFVDSDHGRKDITLQFRNGLLTASPYSHPWSGAYGASSSLPTSMRKVKSLTSSFLSGNQATSMWGSATYNAVRKEFVAMAYNTGNAGRFDVAIWKDIDWGSADPDVSLLPNTPTHLWSITTPSWDLTNSESQYNIKPVLVDNGDIYYSVMFPSSNFKLYRITRAVGDGSGSVSLLSTQSLTTSYGKEQGNAYGQRSLDTRSGNMVVTYCPYYYYACGLRSFIIDKRNSNWADGRQSTSSAYGMNPLEYRDDSFAFVQAGNYYADNYAGIGTMGFASPSQTVGGQPVINTSSWYLPIAPQPNTTNYIGVFQVWDYNLQTVPPAYSGRKA